MGHFVTDRLAMQCRRRLVQECSDSDLSGLRRTTAKRGAEASAVGDGHSRLETSGVPERGEFAEEGLGIRRLGGAGNGHGLKLPRQHGTVLRQLTSQKTELTIA
jgi:hypothetical protein